MRGPIKIPTPSSKRTRPRIIKDLASEEAGMSHYSASRKGVDIPISRGTLYDHDTPRTAAELETNGCPIRGTTRRALGARKRVALLGLFRTERLPLSGRAGPDRRHRPHD